MLIREYLKNTSNPENKDKEIIYNIKENYYEEKYFPRKLSLLKSDMYFDHYTEYKDKFDTDTSIPK